MNKSYAMSGTALSSNSGSPRKALCAREVFGEEGMEAQGGAKTLPPPLHPHHKTTKRQHQASSSGISRRGLCPHICHWCQGRFKVKGDFINTY